MPHYYYAFVLVTKLINEMILNVNTSNFNAIYYTRFSSISTTNETISIRMICYKLFLGLRLNWFCLDDSFSLISNKCKSNWINFVFKTLAINLGLRSLDSQLIHQSHFLIKRRFNLALYLTYLYIILN